MRSSKQLHYLFLLHLLASIVVFVGAWALVIMLANEPLFFLYFITIMVALTLVLGIIKSRIDRITNESYMVKINANPGPPLDVKRAHNLNGLRTHLISKDFVQYANDSQHALFYRARKDDIKKMLKGYTLEVVVYTTKIEPEFYLSIVDEEVQLIREKLHNEKKNIQQMLITQIKQVDTLTQDVKEKTSEIFFMRLKRMVVSTINVAVDLSTDKAVMLYSDEYSPSLYYKKHIDFIKKII